MTDIGFEPVDFSPVDRFADPAHLDAAVQGVMVRARPTLVARASGGTVLPLIAAWARPALAAAAVVATVSVVALAVPAGRAPAVVLALPVAEALDIPAPVSDWLVDERGPTTSDLIIALETLP